MTPRCQLCGEFANENTTILPAGDVCFSCIIDLVDSEIEKRGLAEDERRRRQYFSGEPTAADRERQDLIDAGRYRG